MWVLIAGFLTAFFVTLLSMPVLIKVAKIKHLVDEPKEERKRHLESIPTIGGIVIFAAILFSTGLWIGMGPGGLETALPHYQDFAIIASCLILLFFIGVKDDIIGTAPLKKLVGHLIVAFILVFMGNIKITSFHGLFGLTDIPEYAAVLLSVFSYIVIVNAVNLIDGIDGLAGGVSLIACSFFGVWFFYNGFSAQALIAIVTVGALMGFLVFNTQPARVFMGDSGSLILGLILSYLAFRMIEFGAAAEKPLFSSVNNTVLAMSFLVYPLVDTLRVFMLRALQGKSPFSADRQHIHHKLLRLNFSHIQTSLILYAYSLLIPFVIYFLNLQFNETITLVLGVLIAFLLAIIPFIFEDRSK
ncbi:MAG: glycosyltransferase family 4 protein [Luteibaculaceae bacterium]